MVRMAIESSIVEARSVLKKNKSLYVGNNTYG